MSCAGRLAALFAVLVLIVAGALAFNYLRPVPDVTAAQTLPPGGPAGTAPRVPWPAQGQAAVGAQEAGVLAATPGARPLPTASVAKVMTALVVLQAKPLKQGQQGPLIPISAEDVQAYQQALAGGESVVQVQVGEQLTEYQALQALLIPSGNNIAALLGRWAFGSDAATLRRLNAEAKALGLDKTTFADASGFSTQTVSVPSDLVRLGEEALKDPVFAEIVGQSQATVPVAGTVYNVNYALGQDGIVGIKTGSTPQAGGVYLFAAPDPLPDGRRTTIVGAVQGLPTLDDAFSAARKLLVSVRAVLKPTRVVTRNQAVGRFSAPWGSATDVLAAEDLDVLVWPGTVIRATLEVDSVRAPVSPRTPVGTLRVTAADRTYDVPVATADQLYAPGRLWRLTRLS